MMAPADSIQELEATYELATRAIAGDDFALLDRVILHVLHAATGMGGHQITYDHRLVRALLLSRAWNSLWLARKALSTGYLPQALLLARSAMEDWGTALYVEQRPDHAPRWLQPPAPPTARGQTPSFGEIWTALDPRSELGLAGLYEDLSMFAHPRAATLPYFAQPGDTGLHFQFGPPEHWDRSDLHCGLRFLLQIALHFFRVAGALREELAGSVDRPWLDEAISLSQEIRKRLRALHDEVRQAAQQPGP